MLNSRALSCRAYVFDESNSPQHETYTKAVKNVDWVGANYVYVKPLSGVG